MRSALRVYDSSLWIIAHPRGADVMPSDGDGLFHPLVQGPVIVADRRDVRGRQDFSHLSVTCSNRRHVFRTNPPIDAQLGHAEPILVMRQRDPTVIQGRLLGVVIERVRAVLGVKRHIGNPAVAGVTLINPGAQEPYQRPGAPGDI